MAIIKVINKSGKTKEALRAVIKYVAVKSCETIGINCSNNYKEITKEFFETKNFFCKTEGRQYRHYIQSFAPGEVKKEDIKNIAIDWAKCSFKNHEVFIAIHDDKDHLHAHFIVNTTNFKTGKKLHESKKQLEEKKNNNDKICIKYRITPVEKKKEVGEITSYCQAKYQIIKKGADITQLTKRILEFSQNSISKSDFILKMNHCGYSVEWEENKKHVTFSINPKILKGKKNKFRLTNIQKTFNIPFLEKEKMLKIFCENYNQVQKNILEKIKYSSNFEEKLDKNEKKEVMRER